PGHGKQAHFAEAAAERELLLARQMDVAEEQDLVLVQRRLQSAGGRWIDRAQVDAGDFRAERARNRTKLEGHVRWTVLLTHPSYSVSHYYCATRGPGRKRIGTDSGARLLVECQSISAPDSRVMSSRRRTSASNATRRFMRARFEPAQRWGPAPNAM